MSSSSAAAFASQLAPVAGGPSRAPLLCSAAGPRSRRHRRPRAAASSGGAAPSRRADAGQLFSAPSLFPWLASVSGIGLSLHGSPPREPPAGGSRFRRPDRPEDDGRGAENDQARTSPYLPKMRVVTQQDVHPGSVQVVPDAGKDLARELVDPVRGGLAAGVAVAWLVCGLSLLKTLAGKEDMDELLDLVGRTAVVGAALSGATAAVSW